MHLHAFKLVHPSVYLFACTNTHTHTYTHTCTRTQTHTPTCLNACAYPCGHKHTHTHTHTHTCMHGHVCMHTYVHMPADILVFMCILKHVHHTYGDTCSYLCILTCIQYVDCTSEMPHLVKCIYINRTVIHLHLNYILLHTMSEAHAFLMGIYEND